MSSIDRSGRRNFRYLEATFMNENQKIIYNQDMITIMIQFSEIVELYSHSFWKTLENGTLSGRIALIKKLSRKNLPSLFIMVNNNKIDGKIQEYRSHGPKYFNFMQYDEIRHDKAQLKEEQVEQIVKKFKKYKQNTQILFEGNEYVQNVYNEYPLKFHLNPKYLFEVLRNLEQSKQQQQEIIEENTIDEYLKFLQNYYQDKQTVALFTQSDVNKQIQAYCTIKTENLTEYSLSLTKLNLLPKFHKGNASMIAFRIYSSDFYYLNPQEKSLKNGDLLSENYLNMIKEQFEDEFMLFNNILKKKPVFKYIQVPSTPKNINCLISLARICHEIFLQGKMPENFLNAYYSNELDFYNYFMIACLSQKQYLASY